MTARPFGDYADQYAAAGWIPLPLPGRRAFPPPRSNTGPRSLPPSRQSIDRWRKVRPSSNIGLRLPTTVVGFDVDDRRLGGALIARLEQKFGPLRPVWQIRYSATRRVYLFRIPEGVELVAQLGVGVDVIQHNRGYVMAPPSTYCVGCSAGSLDPRDTHEEHAPVFVIAGAELDTSTVPAAADAPELPAVWLAAFRRSPQPHPSTYEYDRWAGATDDEIRAEADRVDAIVSRFSADALPSIVRNGRRHFVDGSTAPGPVLYVVADGRPVRPYVPTEELGDHEAVGVFEFTTWARTPPTEENRG